MFLNHIEELVWEDSAGNVERYRCVRGADGITVFASICPLRDGAREPVRRSVAEGTDHRLSCCFAPKPTLSR